MEDDTSLPAQPADNGAHAHLDPWLSAALEEYRSVRQESLQALQSQQSVLRFGIAGIAVLIGVGLRASDSLTSAALLLVVTPLLTCLLVPVWQGELARMVRAGSYLARVEEKVNGVVASGRRPALEWEQWLRDHPEYRLLTYYRAIFLVIALLTASSVALGLYVLLRVPDYGLAFTFGPIGSALLTAGVVLYVRGERRQRHLAQRGYSALARGGAAFVAPWRHDS